MSHLTVAASESAVVKLFEFARDQASFSDADSGSFGPFTAAYAVAAHLEGGTVDLRSDGSISVSELDIKWDTLSLTLGFDIPEICVGGWCIVPNPFDGCWVRLPKICVFDDDPDVSIPLDLSGVLTSEVSFRAAPVIRYFVDPARAAWMSDLDAEDAGVPNKWQLYIDPITIDIDIFDVADVVGDLLESAVDTIIDDLLGWLPGWAKDLVREILGPVIDLVRAILDLPDDLEEWLSNLLGVSLGLLDSIITFVGDYFATQYPIHQIEDPYPIMDADPAIPLIPVKLPIRDLAVTIDDDEMVLSANVGAP